MTDRHQGKAVLAQLLRARSALAMPAHWLGGQVLAERDRWVLWMPVALGAGAAHTALHFQMRVR